MDEIEAYNEECKKLVKSLIKFEIQITKLKIIQHEIKSEIYEIFDRLKHITYIEDKNKQLETKWREFNS